MREQLVFLDRDTTDRGDVDFSGIESLGDLICYPISARTEVAGRIAGADIVLTNKTLIGAGEMDAAPKLKLIQVVATGVNNIDLNAAKERGLAVCNVSGYSTAAVAQHVFASLLNLVTNVHRFAAEPEKWAQSPIFTRLDYPVTELAGKTLGIVGLGSIGQAVARIAAAFDMKVIAYGREGSSNEGPIPRLAHDAFFAAADAITLHCPLTPETRHFIDADTLARMKPGAVLINTGRGDLVNEAALVQALQSRAIRAAAVDVLTPEPPSADHPFLVACAAGLDNLFITPHTAWSALEARQRLLDGIVANVLAFRKGERLNRVV
ncbi:MAG TPA: D-2-hydroxyacid dehydrogenase [Verrucomicrobiales bacterium]|nr:D-2-hydroxyacid dehydrogenase [Verrucomicrobiales bacterium]